MRLLVTIAARGGSKGVPDKNIKTLAGKPLIVHTIEQVKRWGKFDRFIVSTDSGKIAEAALRSGVEVPFMRPSYLAGDRVGKLEVLRHALKEAEKIYKQRFDAVLDLDATAPVRTVRDIDNIVGLFKTKKADCVFSVVKARKNPYFNMVEKSSDGTVKVCKKPSREVLSRQAAPEVFDMNASMYVYKRDFLLDEKNRTPYAKKSYAYEMAEESAVDIDTEKDFRFVEFLIKEGLVKL